MARKAKNRINGKASDGYAREPNGQLSRKQEDMNKRAFAQYDQQERETMETALAARERVYGLPRAKLHPKTKQPVAVSRDAMAGSFIGRLCLQGEITITQYDAAIRWLEDWNAYCRAIQAPKSPGAVQINDAPKGGHDGDYENVSRNKLAIESYDNAKRAVQAAQYEPSNGGGSRIALLGALWHVVQQDMERRDMVADFRVAANVLARHYKLTAKQREAA